MSSIMPSGVTVELFASYKIVGVVCNPSILSLCMVSLVMTLMATPKSIKAFFIDWPLMMIVTIELPRSEYFGITRFPNIISTSCPIT